MIKEYNTCKFEMAKSFGRALRDYRKKHRLSQLFLCSILNIGQSRLSKIEAGKLDLHQDQVRINILLEQLIQMFRLQADAKGLEFIYECEGHLPDLVRTDEKRLRHIS